MAQVFLSSTNQAASNPARGAQRANNTNVIEKKLLQPRLESLRTNLSEPRRQISLDRRVVPGPELEAKVGELLERVGLHDRKDGGPSRNHRLQPRQERRPPGPSRRQRPSRRRPAIFAEDITVTSGFGVGAPPTPGGGVGGSGEGTAAVEELDELGRERLEVYAEALVVLELVVVVLADLRSFVSFSMSAAGVL